ncbi:MAG: response regulator transcription factor [Nitriliruptorales bacterium]|nr:response regulator transcription factor [Nitriliruptorales bacterium]
MARILYAEDDPSVAAMVDFRLTDEGHDVTLAGDGDEARRLLEQHTYDVVLLDIMMPGVDGFALCRELAGREDPPGILIISARDRDEDVRTGMEAGADGYLIKPFDPQELVDAVEELSPGS